MTDYTLPAVLDTSAAAALRLEMLQRIEARQPMRLDGGNVTRAGQACLQVLASARASAAITGQRFALTNRSEVLENMTALAGLELALESVN
jgi:chemotaxis protein CheX